VQIPVRLGSRAFRLGGLVLALSVLNHGVASAQLSLSKDDQKCVNEINKNVAKVVKAQGGDIKDCIKNGAKGKLGGQSIEECITSDPKGKVQKATGGLTSKVGSKCAGPPAFPPIDPADTAGINARAIQKDLSLIHWIFGTDLDAVILNAEKDKNGSKCQQALVKDVLKCQDTKLKAYNECKKNKLKGKDTSPAMGADELELECLHDATTGGIPDGKGKLDAACVTKLDDDIAKKCGGQDPDELFPGCAGEELRTCLDQKIECEVCLLLDAIDGLYRSCDEFDDGVRNGSCRCGDGILDPGEICDDGNRDNGDGCSAICVLEGPIGTRTCALDTDAFCQGGERDGLVCVDTVEHSDCPPRAPAARCIQDSNFFIHSLSGSPQFTLPLTGDVEIDCGAVDPNTGKAPCDCELGLIEGVDIPGIGAACIVSGFELCPPGEIDCDGGNALDTEEIHDHDVAPAANVLDPNQFPLELCGINNPDGNAECEAMCEVYCASLEGSFAYFNSGCEGFCVEGPRDGLPCEFDGDCPDGSCPGGDPVSHRYTCNCSCVEIAGIPSRPGALHCNIRAGLNIEGTLPCDGNDVLITTIQPCVPFTTERTTSTVLQAGSQASKKIGPLSASGTPTTCEALAADVSSGLDVVAAIGFIDTGLGDLVVQFRALCQ
jgi:cysteine-rich repeat protein